MSDGALLDQLAQAVLDGDDDAAPRLAARGLDADLAPLQVVEAGLVPAIRRAGDLFAEGELFLPELVTAAQAMKAAMAVIEPHLAEGALPARGRVVIGTVEGDIHDIGKTLVATLLGANGFEVTDLGASVPVARFVETAREVDADIVGASALLTTTMAIQRDLVIAVREAGLRARVLIGGAPTSPQWAGEIGADGQAGSAAAAVERAVELRA